MKEYFAMYRYIHVGVNYCQAVNQRFQTVLVRCDQ